MRQINDAGIHLIRSFEGLVLHPYLDTGGVATIGIGTTKYPDGRHVTMSDPAITEEEANSYLMHDVATCEQQVAELVTVPINDNQFSALVSFTYNLGAHALAHSTLLRLLNTGDYEKAAEEFLRWDHDNGVRKLGLTKRRQAERSLFLHPVYSSPSL